MNPSQFSQTVRLATDLFLKQFRLLPLASVTLLTLSTLTMGCQKTVTERIVSPPVDRFQSGTTHGTETHGGDLTPSEILSIYDKITLTSEQLAAEDSINGEEYVKQTAESGGYKTFKEDLLSLWKGIELYAKGGRIKNLNGRKYLDLVLSLLKGNEKGTIYDEILASTYNVKIEEPFEWMSQERLGKYKYGKCKDYLGVYRAAGATLNDYGGEICINSTELARQMDEDQESKMWGIVSHEHCHHLGLLEEDCLDVQQLIIKHGYDFLRLGNSIQRIKSISIVDRMKTENVYRGLDKKIDLHKITLVATYEFDKSVDDQLGMSFGGVSYFKGGLTSLESIWMPSSQYPLDGTLECQRSHIDSSYTARCHIKGKLAQDLFMPVIEAQLNFRMGYVLPYGSIRKVEMHLEKEGQIIPNTSFRREVSEMESNGLDVSHIYYVFE